MEQRLSSRHGRKQASLLWGAAYILLGLRYSQALAAQLFRGVRSMKESSTYQAILEEGRLVGITIGRTEGRTEGAVAEARRMLRIMGDGQFGPADAQTAATIERIADVARLEDLASRLKAASSWQELLGPTSRRKKKR